MRKLTLTLVAFAVLGGGVVTEPAQARTKCLSVHQAINYYRGTTHTWQMKYGHQITKASKLPIIGCQYARWVAKLWMRRSAAWRERYEARVRWQRMMSDPVTAIKHVFGAYATQAIAVARCESGLYVWASNGQYQGMFQMGESERATYGHGSTPLSQARAAHRYFVATGRTWGPWQCKPW